MGTSKMKITLQIRSLISLIRDITTTAQGTRKNYEIRSICFIICQAQSAKGLISFRMNIPFE